MTELSKYAMRGCDGQFPQSCTPERGSRKVISEWNEALGSLVGELVEGVCAAGHVLWSGKIEQTNESDEIVATWPLVDMLVQPSDEQRVKGRALQRGSE